MITQTGGIRQNPDGSWSHKLSTQRVSNLDNSDRTIWNPEDADRNYTKANANHNGCNYSKLVGFYAVRPLNLMYDFTDVENGE